MAKETRPGKETRAVPDLTSGIKLSKYAREISIEEAIEWLREESLDGKRLNRVVTAVRDPGNPRNFLSITFNEAL